MKIRLSITAVVAIAMIGVFFVDVPTQAQAQTPGIDFGPWVDSLVFSEQVNSGLALQEVKSGDADFFLFSLQGGTEKTESFLSPDIFSVSQYGSINALLFNPNRQVGDDLPAQQAMNPFTDAQIREAMNWLIDRNFLNLEVLDGFGVSFASPFHPKQPEYFRELELNQQIEADYAADFTRARSVIFGRMVALGATRDPTGDTATTTLCSAALPQHCWRDSFGDLIDIRIQARIEDERAEIGQYVSTQLNRVGLKTTIVPIPGGQVGARIYGSDPSIGIWHIYTEGWAATLHQAWDDAQLFNFHAGGIGETFFVGNTPAATYTVPASFNENVTVLAFGQYSGSAQRQQIMKDFTRTAMTTANHRMWLQVEQAVFPVSQRVESAAYDATGGPWSDFTLKSARLLPGQPGVDRATGVGGDLRVLNFLMFVDSWNPWRGNWLYDSLQRQTIGDPGMQLSPNTGQWIEYRLNVTSQTAGPTGTMAIPPTALVWNVTQGKFTTLASEGASGWHLTAVSKVTSKLANPGKWHTGQDITMDDMIYGLGTAFRRAFGDVRTHDPRGSNSIGGLRFTFQAARWPSPVAQTDGGVFKAFEIDLAANTLTAYLDYWHLDPQEIKNAGFIYMMDEEVPTPWEIQEAALKAVIDDKLAIHETTAGIKGLPRLDLGRDPTSISLIDDAFTANRAANAIPAFMVGIPSGVGNVITSAEATARYNAAAAFRATRGHWYASNGPFYLESINPTFRQSKMVAFRDGYPFTADHWEGLKVKRVPTSTFGTFPPSLLAGTSTTLGVTTKLGTASADAKAIRWFVRQLATGGIPIRGDAVRTGLGSYEVQLLSTDTVGLATGGYELVVVIQGEAGSELRTLAFSVTSQLDFFSALFNEVEDRLDTQGQQLTDLTGDVGTVQSSASSLQTLVSAVLVLAIVAIVVPAAMLAILLRRLPSKASMPEKERPPEEL